MLLNRMIRNVGKLPYEKNQIINYARQEISIQLIFPVLMRAHLSISLAIIRCKMLKPYKRGTRKEKWTVMTFQASSFLYFQIYSILCFVSAKRERFFHTLGNFFPLQVNTFNQVKTSDIMKKYVMCIFHTSDQYILIVDTRVTHSCANTTHTIHTRADSINKERNVPLVNVPFYQLDEYAESAFFCRAHI